jgi:hypothetical protein
MSAMGFGGGYSATCIVCGGPSHGIGMTLCNRCNGGTIGGTMVIRDHPGNKGKYVYADWAKKEIDKAKKEQQKATKAIKKKKAPKKVKKELSASEKRDKEQREKDRKKEKERDTKSK